MKDIDGAMVALVGGGLYLIFICIMGLEAGSLLSVLVRSALAVLIAGGEILVLFIFFPPATIWTYPLVVSLPTLLVGLLALADGSRTVMVFAIGVANFFIGLVMLWGLRRRMRESALSQNTNVGGTLANADELST